MSFVLIIFRSQVVTSIRPISLVHARQMWFYLLKRKSCLRPTTNGQNIFLITADLKLSRLPPRSPLPLRLYLLCRCSQQLRLQMTRITEEKGARKQNTASIIRPTHLRYPWFGFSLYWLLTTSCDAALLNSR